MDNTAQPIIIETENNRFNHPGFFRNFSNNIPKLIFLGLGLIVAFEIFVGIKTLTQPIPKAPERIKVLPVSTGQMILITDKTSYRVGDVVPVSVKITTGGNLSSGVDLILHYDPSLFTVNKDSLVKGSIFPEYPIADVDPKTGTISLSGISTVTGVGFNGVGIFATINMTAKAPGQSKVTVDYTPNQTNESNITESSSAKDLLDKVGELDITVI